jgi:hypothetical protein
VHTSATRGRRGTWFGSFKPPVTQPATSRESPKKSTHTETHEHIQHSQHNALLEAKKNLHFFWETCFLPFAGKELPPELETHREKFESFDAFVGTCFEAPIDPSRA